MLFMYDNDIIYLLLILIITIITLCKAIFDLAYLHVNIQLLLCVSHLKMNSDNDLLHN